jgi:hypothetical protein
VRLFFLMKLDLKELIEYLAVLVVVRFALVEERLLLEKRWEQGTVAQP